MKKSIYTPYCFVQDYLTEYFLEFEKNTEVVKAIQSIYMANKTSTIPFTPDFSSWDVSDSEQLVHIFSENTIDISPIIRDPKRLTTNVSEDYFIFSDRDAKILLHFYNEAAHTHSHNYFEINYVLKGSMKFECVGETRTMSEGELCIIAPETNHTIEADDQSIIICIVIKKSTFHTSFFDILRYDSLLSQFFHNSLYTSNKNYLLFIVPPSEKFCEIIKNIFIESHSNEPNANAVCCSYINIFLNEVLRNFSNTYLYFKPTNTISSQITPILAYIKNNYQSVSLQFLAEKFNYDAAYLGKQIKRLTGSSYNEIVNKYKVDNAVLLLKYSEKKISEISESVGYNSTDHFSRCFKDEFNLSPIQYRKKIQSNFENDDYSH
ncbi:AraC family transcriptional regulator [Trichococcus shcherbakoviae]|uniref:AraC family transcriptional regulator n=1 Tax=Trichococcus shcherbakoviae TaxID=2094020 RepID=UPI0029F4954D|nr:AraC family transcriptional regulator [Trichococcus shcherbakoviae]